MCKFLKICYDEKSLFFQRNNKLKGVGLFECLECNLLQTKRYQVLILDLIIQIDWFFKLFIQNFVHAILKSCLGNFLFVMLVNNNSRLVLLQLMIIHLVSWSIVCMSLNMIRIVLGVINSNQRLNQSQVQCLCWKL